MLVLMPKLKLLSLHAFLGPRLPWYHLRLSHRGYDYRLAGEDYCTKCSGAYSRSEIEEMESLATRLLAERFVSLEEVRWGTPWTASVEERHQRAISRYHCPQGCDELGLRCANIGCKKFDWDAGIRLSQERNQARLKCLQTSSFSI